MSKYKIREKAIFAKVKGFVVFINLGEYKEIEPETKCDLAAGDASFDRQEVL